MGSKSISSTIVKLFSSNGFIYHNSHFQLKLKAKAVGSANSQTIEIFAFCNSETEGISRKNCISVSVPLSEGLFFTQSLLVFFCFPKAFPQIALLQPPSEILPNWYSLLFRAVGPSLRVLKN